ncbi:uncharacterized protein F5147DRAFT_704590 [Suillus discolor]|uniref:Uncharacterized protein n=1 Tax=Suillus discolor TaxID=1912936 RepID=A0A9P7F2H2_9AGAM|nr:uncharacterized protein F5147DRAFT_704590 [Suillus discolor]KAG2104426.1 hypothetical protein F5147DRAFT_704590 [Suillus discolor]
MIPSLCSIILMTSSSAFERFAIFPEYAISFGTDCWKRVELVLSRRRRELRFPEMHVKEMTFQTTKHGFVVAISNYE